MVLWAAYLKWNHLYTYLIILALAVYAYKSFYKLRIFNTLKTNKNAQNLKNSESMYIF